MSITLNVEYYQEYMKVVERNAKFLINAYIFTYFVGSSRGILSFSLKLVKFQEVVLVLIVMGCYSIISDY